MVRVIMFDFDGTLVNSMERLTQIAAEELTRECDISYNDAIEFYKKSSGLPFSEQVDLLFPDGEKNSIVVERFEKRKRKELFTYPLFDDTEDVVNELRRREYKVVVSSSNFEYNVVDYFDKKGLVLDLILGYRDGFGKGKPHFDRTLKQFGVKKEELVFVGDSLMDAERAIGYGVKFIAKTGMFDANTFRERYSVPVIENLRELLKVY